MIAHFLGEFSKFIKAVLKMNQEFKAQEFFRADLVDLGDIINSDMCGILAPKGDLNSKKNGVTDQFLKNANTYHEKYFNTAYFSHCLSKALSKILFSKDDPFILDIGSGSGNTVLPALELFKNSRIIATDISENLLYILKEYLKNNLDYKSRVSLVCMDATKVNYYKENMFDLVIGAAILHHLINPYSCIEAACKSLKKGGAAIFFEPFENGSSILRIAYTEILRNVEMDYKNRNFLEILVDDIAVKTGTDKSKEIFHNIDDKWLFTKKFFNDAAEKLQVQKVMIYPLHDTKNQFRNQTITFLKLGMGAEPGILPDQAWEIVDYYDSLFSPELKEDLLIEGAIILIK